MEYKDYYRIMGLERDAKQDEVKRAYRKLARKYHPDVSQEADAEVRFKEIGEAYEVLKDIEKRAAYDQLGNQWQAGQEFHPPPGWDEGFEFSGRGEGFDDSVFSDFFESLYGRTRSGQQRQSGFSMRGQDHHARIIVDLKDSYNGATRSIGLQMPDVSADGHVVTRNRTLNVQIPKGIRQGQQIRLAGQGGAAFGEGEPGDLYLEVEFGRTGNYRVEGADVYFDVPIAPWEAALGSKIEIPTPSGTVELTIPRNARAGQKLRLKGRGIPAREPGDLFVVLQIVVPPADTAERREFYQQMRQSFEFNPRTKLEV
jgi:curved DNA-binding protein